MIESQYGDKTFPSFVKWLVGWRVSYEDLKHNRVKIFLRTFWQEVHTDLCPDPDEDTPVACAFNPHWDQLQQRFLSHYFDLPPPFLLSCFQGVSTAHWLTGSLPSLRRSKRTWGHSTLFYWPLTLIDMIVPGILVTLPMWRSTKVCRRTEQEKELPLEHLVSSSRYPFFCKSDSTSL